MISTRKAAAAVLLAGAAGLLAAGAAADPRGADYFPNVPLVTQDGKTVRFYDDLLKGKKVVINVIFTSCTDVCPLETANLVQLTKILGERVGRDVYFYSLSIDPQRDTPPALKAYAEKFGAGGPGWLFLTGKPEDIKAITKKLALVRDRGGNPTSRESHHAPYLVLGIESSGLWTRKHATTNPRFLASTMNTFFGWPETEPQRSYAEARPLQINEGLRLFQSRCNSCHTIGQGDKIGPDLRGVTDRRERAWLARYIADAPQVLSSGDPVAAALHNKYKKVVMPYLGLSASQVAEVISFLDARDDAVAKRTQEESTHAR